MKLPSMARIKETGIGLVVLLLLTAWLIYTPPGLLGKADATGYAVCHRIDGRSFHLGDRQLPLCIRCTGMYLGVVLGLGYLARINPKRGGVPSRPVLILLTLLGLAFLIDGVNSFLSLFPGGLSLYTPQHALRLVTGVGMGLVIAIFVFITFNQTAWAEWDPRPVLNGGWAMTGLLLLALILAGLVWIQNSIILYPLALISAAGVWLVLSLVYTVLFLSLTRRENRIKSLLQLRTPIMIGFGLALAQIIVLDLFRFILTGTWGGFPLG
jgi:uncharacterized membrane protein